MMNGCLKCGSCLAVCHAYQHQQFPGPRRLAVEFPRFQEVSAETYICTTCGRCEAVCPAELPLTQAIIRMRGSMFPPTNAGQQKVLELAARTNHAVEIRDYTAPTEGKTLLFPGCVGKGGLAGRPEAVIKLLTAAGAEPYIDPALVCCGSPLAKMGAEEEAERLQNINHPLLAAADKVVTVCPGCTTTLNKTYGINALHILEYLEDVSLPFIDGDEVRVYLHHPCHLARGVGPHTMDAARKILERVPGVTILDCGGEEDCCGGGGGVLAAYPREAYDTAARKAKVAVAAGADLIIAPCPFCAVNLRRPKLLPALELSEFLASRLKL
ncbi:(Fe-S)-binding protein [Candidatus Methanomassiliicoccus intestinalis]|uniref:(Fe-S)-binding protein n=1 Tax=Candidatus Methanomassiliicoccus intestinalis TaxID=1406512 RepID=UPI0037DD43BA